MSPGLTDNNTTRTNGTPWDATANRDLANPAIPSPDWKSFCSTYIPRAHRKKPDFRHYRADYYNAPARAARSILHREKRSRYAIEYKCWVRRKRLSPARTTAYSLAHNSPE